MRQKSFLDPDPELDLSYLKTRPDPEPPEIDADSKSEVLHIEVITFYISDWDAINFNEILKSMAREGLGHIPIRVKFR